VLSGQGVLWSGGRSLRIGFEGHFLIVWAFGWFGKVMRWLVRGLGKLIATSLAETVWPFLIRTVR
jgi:hypothetical protein